jgi:hypothetical protein
MTFPIVITALLLSAGSGAAPQKPSEGGAPTAASAPASAKDPAALGLLRRMCDRLRSAKTFSIRGRVSLELPVAEGTLATFFNDYEIAVRRPDGLSARRVGDLPDFRLVYDGKSMTLLVPGKLKWATTSAPPTIDAMLPVADEKGGLNMPFDELIVADPCAAIMAGVREVVVTRAATIRGKKVEHLVLSGPQFRIEYWIDPATALPVRSLVVYVDDPQRPHFQVEYAEWKLDPKLPASTFALPRPKGATQVDFREAASEFQ